MNFRTLVTALVAVMLVATPMNAAAATGPPVNFGADKAPDLYKHEQQLEKSEHKMGEMGLLDYYADDGVLTSLNASVNGTQDTPAGVRFDKIDADRYQLFPRISGEAENHDTWLNTSNWTKSSGASSSMTISDNDGVTANGVPAVTFDASVASTETATANFSESNLDITSDPDKRVLLFVGDVSTLASGANVTIQAHDEDGDFRYASINESGNASKDHVIVTSATSGVFFQERLSNLPMGGNGDGTLDEISYVKIVGHEANSKVHVVGLDVGSKSMVDLAEVMRDGGDSDSKKEPTTLTNYTSGGYANVTSLDSLSSDFDDATIHDLRVYNVRYSIRDLTDPDDYRVEFAEATEYGAYPQKLTIEARLTVPTAIDLSHTGLSLRGDQAFVNERYAELKVAEDTSDKNLSEVNSTHYTDKSSVFSEQDQTHTLLSSGITAGTDDTVQLVVLLQDGEAAALQATGGVAGGPTGKSGGFFSTVWGQITGIAGAIVAFVTGIRKFGGGN